MNLLLSLRSELLKTRRTAAFYLTLIAAALVPFILLLDVTVDGISAENRIDPLNAIVREGFTVLSVLVIPMFVILVCTLLPQIEYRNNTWKQVFASPQNMAQIFFAKFLNVHLLTLLFLVTYNVFMVMVVFIMNFVDPALDLLNQPLDGYTLLANNAKGYISLLGISAIQFWLGLRFKNFIPPIAIGFSMWVVGSMMVMEFHTSNAYMFPYAHVTLSFLQNYAHLVPTVQLWSVGYAVVFLFIGFMDFRRRKAR
jgi:hypothetical protein